MSKKPKIKVSKSKEIIDIKALKSIIAASKYKKIVRILKNKEINVKISIKTKK